MATTLKANTGWTEEEQARIKLIQEERGVSRGQAIRVMRAEQVRGVTTVLEHGREVEVPAEPVATETPAMAAATQANLDKVNAGLTGKPHTGKAPKATAKAKKAKPDYDKAQRIRDGICLYRDADGPCPKKVQVVNGKKRRCCPEHMEHFRKRNKKYAKDHAK